MTSLRSAPQKGGWWWWRRRQRRCAEPRVADENRGADDDADEPNTQQDLCRTVRLRYKAHRVTHDDRLAKKKNARTDTTSFL